MRREEPELPRGDVRPLPHIRHDDDDDVMIIRKQQPNRTMMLKEDTTTLSSADLLLLLRLSVPLASRDADVPSLFSTRHTRTPTLAIVTRASSRSPVRTVRLLRHDAFAGPFHRVKARHRRVKIAQTERE